MEAQHWAFSSHLFDLIASKVSPVKSYHSGNFCAIYLKLSDIFAILIVLPSCADKTRKDQSTVT
jgi:hypothetical protein